MSANDPVMRAREPADPASWLDFIIFFVGGGFVIWIALEAAIGIVKFIISGAWVP